MKCVAFVRRADNLTLVKAEGGSAGKVFKAGVVIGLLKEGGTEEKSTL